MKVGIVHNPYQVRGGEDVYARLLGTAYGRLGWKTQVFPEGKPDQPGPLQALAALNPFQDVLENEFFVSGERPDFLHVNHLFPNLGLRPLVWAKKFRVPVLMTVHNHRFFCSNGLAFRDGKVCTRCMDSGAPWRSLLLNCSGDRKKSVYYTAAIGALMASGHLDQTVSRLIAPSPHIESVLLELGFPREKIGRVMHGLDFNDLALPAAGVPVDYDVVYAGRLSAEKGVGLLLETVEREKNLRFVIVGDGPMEFQVQETAARFSNLKFLGRVSSEALMKVIEHSSIGIMPSLCHESFGFAAIEFFSMGRRCVVSNLSSAAWLTQDGCLGVQAESMDPAGISAAIRRALSLPPVASDEVLKIRSRFGFERFCSELSALAREVVSGKELLRI